MSGDHGHAHDHSHNHAHGHAHGHDHAQSVTLNRAFAIGIALNLGFVGVEAFYGWQIDSLALLADAGHNLSDVAGLVLAWAAMFFGRMPANARHTYGWRKASVLAAFANAVLLLVAMVALAVEAIARLKVPASTEGLTIIVVAGIGIVVNTATALLFLRGQPNDINVRGAFLHMAADALVSAAVVVSGVAYLLYGWGWIDPVMSLVIAAVIVVGTWRLFRQSVHLMFDGVPEHIDAAAVRRWLQAQPGVSDVHDLHIWAMSSTEVALTAHLVMPAGHPGDGFLDAVSLVLHEQFRINHPTLQIETASLLRACGKTCGAAVNAAQ